MKEIMDKLGFLKIQNICSAKGTVNRMERQDGEKIFAKHISPGVGSGREISIADLFSTFNHVNVYLYKKFSNYL